MDPVLSVTYLSDCWAAMEMFLNRKWPSYSSRSVKTEAEEKLQIKQMWSSFVFIVCFSPEIFSQTHFIDCSHWKHVVCYRRQAKTKLHPARSTPPSAECLLVQIAAVHSGCCRFSTLWSKGSTTAVFSPHVTTIYFESYLHFSAAETDSFIQDHIYSAEVLFNIYSKGNCFSVHSHLFLFISGKEILSTGEATDTADSNKKEREFAV